MRPQSTVLDSLVKEDSAKRNEYDSIIRANPALFDTSAAARDVGYSAWRARQDYRPYGRSSSGPTSDDWATLISLLVVLALVVALVVRQALRVRHARQAASATGIAQVTPADRVRSWHPGQLATAWVGVLLADVVLRWLFAYNGERGSDSNDFGAALCALVGVGLTGGMLWASWTWFGSRDRRS